MIQLCHRFGNQVSYSRMLKKKERVTRSQLAILVYTLVTFFLLIFCSETLRMAMEKLHKWSLIDPCHLHVWHGSPWGLGCFKQLFVDRANLWFKTHVQQAIRFVQDQTFDVTNLKTKGSKFSCNFFQGVTQRVRSCSMFFSSLVKTCKKMLLHNK